MFVHPWAGTALTLIFSVLQPSAQAKSMLPTAFLIAPKSLLLILPLKPAGTGANGACPAGCPAGPGRDTARCHLGGGPVGGGVDSSGLVTAAP